MKRAAAVSLLLAPIAVFAAAKSPVQWSVSNSFAKPIKPGTKFSVVVTGRLDAGWHLYAMEEPKGGPVPTEVALTEGDAADLLRVEESKPKMQPDPMFQQPTGLFDGTARFTLHLQMATDATPGAHTLHVLVKYQSCNDRVCLPPRTDTVEAPVNVQ